MPITKDAGLFESVRSAGARLIWLQTYGQRYVRVANLRDKFRQARPRTLSQCRKPKNVSQSLSRTTKAPKHCM